MAFRNSVKVTLLSLENEKPRAYPARVEPPAPEPVTAPADAPSPAALWHARADDLRALTDTLPSEITRSLMPKIVALYDRLARDEGWREQDARPEEPQPPTPQCVDEEPAEITLAPAMPALEWRTHPRRPLPLGRRMVRRRG